MVDVDKVGNAMLTLYHWPSKTLRSHLLRNVHYMPTNGNINLISLGTLFKSGFKAYGEEGRISLLKDKDEVMRFTPLYPGATVYKVISAPPATAEVAQKPKAIARLSHETMHRRFAHPSEGVLRQFTTHTLGCPEYDANASKSPCSGCAKGKMTNRPFPATTRRATKPFEIIHSDLKSFPVLSYHRYQYIITFYDDCTSHAWIVCLRKKSAAIKATEQF